MRALFRLCNKLHLNLLLSQNYKIKKKVLVIFYALFVLFLLSILAYYGNKTLVGFTIKEAGGYTQTLNLEFNESQNFEFIPEGAGILNSIKLSGIIEGEGEIKIYLDDLLVLDSSKIKETKSISLITGFAIENPESFSEENLTQEAPQIQEESPSQEEPLASENVTANQTETTEQTEPKQIEKEITIKEFSDICEETCKLSKLNLNKSSYTLKIEISNAKLKLEKISYELIPEIAEITSEIPINITPEINITEINATISIQQIEINKPVKWKSEIRAKTLEEAEVKIPKIGKIKSSRILDKELFEVEYETPAPKSYEKEISRTRKIITISAPAELNYTNVLSYTQLTAEVRPEKIKLYHIINGKSELVNIVCKPQIMQ